MKLTFLGAAQTVTGSRFLVESGKAKLLVDCGLFQGLKKLRLKNWDRFPVDVGSLDAVALTHAHIDHSGYLPVLHKLGFRGPILSSKGTRDLAGVLLPDAGHLQEEEARYRNKSGTTKHHPALALYTEEDAERTLKLFAPARWSTPVDVAGGALRVTFHRAAHILGASWLEVSDEQRTVVFSGDVGRPNDLLLSPAEKPQRAPILVLESTYGGRRHSSVDPKDQLAEVVTRTAARGGCLLIPAFAVGRAQQVLLLLAQLKAEKRIPDLPLFLNSPMAQDATDILLRHSDELHVGAEQLAALRDGVRYVRGVEESKELNNTRVPTIIVAGSGMATGGRIVHHLKAKLSDPRNTVLLVGYQAAGTRGEQLARGASHVKIHGQEISVQAEVASIDGLSAHADEEELLGWLSDLQEPPRRTFLVHGEPTAQDALRVLLKDRLGVEAEVPEHGESFEL